MSLFPVTAMYKKYYHVLIRALPEGSFNDTGAEERRRTKEAPQCARCKGSVMVEAAMVLPLLACLFASVLFLFRVMQVELVVQDAADNTAKKISIAYCADKENFITTTKCRIAAKSIITAQLEGRDCVRRFVSGGALGVGLSGSKFDEDEVCLKVNYKMKLPVPLLRAFTFRICQQSCFRKWTGWKLPSDAETDEVIVYIAETGGVYHKTDRCTYLTLSIQSVDLGELDNYRGENGQKYKLCEICAEKNMKSGRVYITNYGNAYHKVLDCSGIKRTVYAIRLSEAGGRRQCLRCFN